MDNQSEPTQLQLHPTQCSERRERAEHRYIDEVYTPAQHSRVLAAMADAGTRRVPSCPYTTHHALHHHPPLTAMTAYCCETILQNDYHGS